MLAQRVTVTLPPDLVEAMDQEGSNRSRFVVEAVQRELARRRREKLRTSLDAPHPESGELAALGADDWRELVTEEDVAELLDPAMGHRVRWVPERGWMEEG